MKLFVSLVVSFFLYGQLGFGQLISEEGGQLVVKFLPDQGEGKGSPIVFTARGLLVNKKLGQVHAIVTQSEFINRIVSANSSGQVGRILELWIDSERDSIKEKVADPKLSAANSSMYRKITKSDLLAYTEYGTYILLFVRHEGANLSSYIRTYPAIDRKGKLFLTNSLKDDVLFSVWTSTLERALRNLPSEK